MELIETPCTDPVSRYNRAAYAKRIRQMVNRHRRWLRVLSASAPKSKESHAQHAVGSCGWKRHSPPKPTDDVITSCAVAVAQPFNGLPTNESRKIKSTK
jgi:hypothetical protein